jgi:hypothetical protein
MPRGLVCLALLGACGPEVADTGSELPSRAMVRATKVSTSNADELLLTGERADGEVGHYAITNGSLSAVVDAAGYDEALDLAEQLHRAPSGGTLVDLAPPGGRDALIQVIQVLGADPDLRVYYQRVSVVEDGKALAATGRILDPGGKLGLARDAQGLVEQVVVTTTWRMWDRQPWVEVETVVSNQAGRLIELDPVLDLFVTDGVGLAPYLPLPGVGFDVEHGSSTVTPWLVLSPQGSGAGSIGVLSLEDETIHVQAERGVDGRVRGVYVGRNARLDEEIPPGEQLGWTRRYTAAGGDDMEGVLRNILQLWSMQEGSIRLELGLAEATAVEIDLEDPRPARISFLRVDPARYLAANGEVQDGGAMPVGAAWSDGSEASITTWLPLGTYRVEVVAPGNAGVEQELEVQAGVERYGEVALGDGSLAPLHVDLIEAGGAPNSSPLRVTVLGLGGTPDPELGRFQLAGASLAAGRRLWTDAAVVELLLPEGSYRLIASRGPAYPLSSAEVRLPVTSSVQLELHEPAWELPGWFSADPFTASSASILGGDSAEDIAFALCAEGVDLVVRAEVGEGGSAAPGCEGQQQVSGVLGALDVPRGGASAGDGWVVAFPISGALAGPGSQPGDWLDRAWDAGARVTALLAPRREGVAGAGAGLFHAHDLQREGLEDQGPNHFLQEASAAGTTVLDAGALELITPADPEGGSAVLQDWFALLDLGYSLFPVASSHSSWLAADHPGVVRTFALSEDDSVEGRLSALAAGGTVASSGPMIEVELRGEAGSARPGQTLSVAPGEMLQLELRVLAADWVPVERVRVIAGGREIRTTEIEPGGPLDHQQTVEFQLGDASWVVVDAGMPDELASGDFALVHPGVPAYAVTAPIYLDIVSDER